MYHGIYNVVWSCSMGCSIGITRRDKIGLYWNYVRGGSATTIPDVIKVITLMTSRRTNSPSHPHSFVRVLWVCDKKGAHSRYWNYRSSKNRGTLEWGCLHLILMKSSSGHNTHEIISRPPCYKKFSNPSPPGSCYKISGILSPFFLIDTKCSAIHWILIF